MDFYCAKWGRLFARETINRLLLVLYGFLLYVGLIGLVLWNGAEEREIVLMILAAIAVFPFTLLYSLQDNYKHRFITVGNQEFSWQQFLTRVEQCGGRIRERRIPYRVTVSVENVHKIKLKQTPIERWLNIGRVSFVAEVRSYQIESGETPPVAPPKPPFEFAGITSFRRFKAYMYETFPPSAFR